jgi:hypothetical protein
VVVTMDVIATFVWANKYMLRAEMKKGIVLNVSWPDASH